MESVYVNCEKEVESSGVKFVDKFLPQRHQDTNNIKVLKRFSSIKSFFNIHLS